MSKSMIVSLAATMIFAVVYITDCCVDAKENQKYDVVIIPETPMIDGVPNELDEIIAMPMDLKEVKAEETTEEETTEEEQPSMTYLGEYTLTAYEYTGNCTADGSTPVEWWTVACNDPALFHKKIFIEGYGDFWVCDTGGMPSDSILDIYLGDYDTCIQFGVKKANVYMYLE